MIHRLAGTAAFLLMLLTAPLRAEGPKPVDQWNVYGTTVRFVGDKAIAGGNALQVAAPKRVGEDWSSSALATLDFPLKAGESATAVFWARAERPVHVPVTLQAAKEPYASFAREIVEIGPGWQRFQISGVATADLALASQLLTVQVGKAGSDVTLGPVLLEPGTPDEAAINAAFAGFRPRWLTEDVRIASDPGVVLAGTLRIPRSHGPGPFPTVLLLWGSGPSPRVGVSPFMERLLKDGIAVLEYDKRGVKESTGELVDTVANMTNDAAAAVAFLRTRADIDRKRVAVAGLSQGGAVGPAIAAKVPAIAAVVMFAGPVSPGKKLVTGGIADQLAAQGVRKTCIKPVTAASRRLLDARTRNARQAQIAPLREAVIRGLIACNFTRAQGEDATKMLDSRIGVESWNSHFDETLASVRAPALALFASEDKIVSTPQNQPAAKAALARNPDARVIEVQDVGHGFRHEKNVSTLERTYAGPIAAPEVIEMVGDWLDARLHPAKDDGSLTTAQGSVASRN